MSFEEYQKWLAEQTRRMGKERMMYLLGNDERTSEMLDELVQKYNNKKEEL